MGGVIRYIAKNNYGDFKASIPKSKGYDDIFAYCHYFKGHSGFVNCKKHVRELPPSFRYHGNKHRLIVK